MVGRTILRTNQEWSNPDAQGIYKPKRYHGCLNFIKKVLIGIFTFYCRLTYLLGMQWIAKDIVYGFRGESNEPSIHIIGHCLVHMQSKMEELGKYLTLGAS